MTFLKKNLGIIIFARSSSKRFPNKIFKKINNLTLLEIIIKRIKSSKLNLPFVIATSSNKSDDRVENFCIKNNIKCFRGSLFDVYDRAVKCCAKYNFDYFVRVCVDRPFFDFNLMDKMVKKILTKKYDIVTNQLPNTYPKGLSCEVAKIDIFKKINKINLLKSEKEHIFDYFYTNKKKYKIFNYLINKKYKINNLSIDTKHDLACIKSIYKKNKYNFKISNKNIKI